MRRVYLDQNKWIDLARSRYGRPDGRRFGRALDACRDAAETGAAAFPLDIHHWMETAKRRDDASRQRLGALMMELSQRHTMCRAAAVVPHEIDNALRAVSGRPASVDPLKVHGVGLLHMTGGGVRIPPAPLPHEFEVSDPRIEELRHRYETLMETMLLIGNAAVRETPEMAALVARMDQDRRYVEAEERWSRLLVDLDHDRGERLYEALSAHDLGDIMGPLAERLKRVGLDPGEFVQAVMASSPWAFVQRLPTRHVTTVMRAVKHAQGQQKWTPSDLNDIVALPIAVVHCDVVVTEKQWVDAFQRTGVDKQYGTTCLSHVEDLAEVLG